MLRELKSFTFRLINQIVSFVKIFRYLFVIYFLFLSPDLPDNIVQLYVFCGNCGISCCLNLSPWKYVVRKERGFTFAQIPIVLGYITVFSSMNLKPIRYDCYLNEIFKKLRPIYTERRENTALNFYQLLPYIFLSSKYLLRLYYDDRLNIGRAVSDVRLVIK